MKPFPLIATVVLEAASLIACVSTKSAAPAPELDAAPSPVAVDDSDTIPCAPRLVLESVCQRCHQSPPIRGAPFPLRTRSDILRVDDDGVVRQRMIEQLTARRMPLFPETIDEESRATLLGWLAQGAPADPPTQCHRPVTKDGGGFDAEDALSEEAGDAEACFDAADADAPID